MEQMRRTVLRGLAAFRWLAWLWMAAVLLLARGSLVAPLTAVALVACAGLVTVWISGQLRIDAARAVRPRVVGVEVGVAAALQLADGFVYASPHVFTARQPLGVAWPTAAALSAGVALGTGPGAATGVLLGAARAVSSVVNATPTPELWLGPLDAEQALSLVTTTVLYAFAGGVAGHATGLLVRAERRLARAERAVAALEAREEVARRLHDGVLQTLALVERRTDDVDLARLARDQERELRRYLADPRTDGTAVTTPAEASQVARELPGLLQDAAALAERRFDLRVELLLPDDLPRLEPLVAVAAADAVAEALTNAGKHAHATRVVVYAEPSEDGVFLSVRDDGRGFDPERTPEGLGMLRSLRAPVQRVGGEVVVDAAAGRGTEVRLLLPVGPARPARPGA